MLPVFEGVYLIITFCLFCISLVIGSNDLDDNNAEKLVQGYTVKIRKNRCGAYIFNFLAFFYFLTLAFILAVLLYVLIFQGFKNQAYLVILVIVPSTLALSLLIYDISGACNYLKYSFFYVYYIPTYVNILQIYSICKTDDLTWGTRGNNAEGFNSKYELFKYKKFFYLITYVFCNSIFGFLFER